MGTWFTLTGFGDEISPHLDEQLGLLKNKGISYIELRGVGGKGVLDLTGQELQKTKELLNGRGMRVSCLASPIGKVSITEDFDIHVEKFKKALSIASFFETRYIRLFSYYIPQDKKPEEFREEVIKRMKKETDIAREKSIILLHENEKRIYGDTPKRCLDILESVDSPYLRAIFDPANFVQIGIDPVKEAFPLLLPYIEYIHIKDALFDTGKVVLPGEGDGSIKEILRSLKKEGFIGFLSLEPHLELAGEKGGFSGKEGFRKAAGALKRILKEINAR